MEPVFGFMKAILGFTRMSVRGLNKVKRELGFVLMALNIRKVVAQRAENNQKFIKRQFLYYFNRNCLFHLSKNFMSRTLFMRLIIKSDTNICMYSQAEYWRSFNSACYSLVIIKRKGLTYE